MTIKEFPRLYTLDNKNKVRIFDCKVSSINTVHITSATGLLNGKLIEKKETVNKGKQNRTVEEQAIFQAQSLWNEKWDEGYKSKDILTGKLVSKNINESIYSENVLFQAAKYIPEWSYTNKNWDELPMLAHKYKDIKNPNFPYLAQPKLDGVRCLVKYINNEVRLISRGGQYYQIPHLLIELSRLFEKIKERNIGNFLLDGEIYKHGIPLQEISGAARREELGMFASNSWLEYHIYDVINLDNLNLYQEGRFMNFDIISELSLPLTNIVKVETSVVDNKSEVDQLHQEYLSQGYEGLILRDPKGKYEFNTRSKSLLKVKEYQDEEFQIIGCGFDENKATIGESFYFILKNNINDLTFKSRPTGTEAMKEEWYRNIEEYKGKRATVRFFARSNDGLPTQGVVRHKDTEMLVKHIRPNGE